jgi:PAS domain S-box-containing protein
MARAPRKTARVLLVDGEPTHARQIRAALAAAGCTVRAFSSGVRALRRLDPVRPDLAVIDATLSGRPDGVDTARAIRERAPALPLLLMVDQPPAGLLNRTRDLAPFAYLSRTPEPATLRAQLHTLLQAALRAEQGQAEERFASAVLRSVGDGLLVADTAGKILFMNPVAEALTGWTLAKALGQDMASVFRTAGDPSHPLAAGTEAEARGDVQPDRILQGADGSLRTIVSTTSPVNDRAGRLVGMVVVFRDVTRRRQHERRALGHSRLEAIGKLGRNIAHEFSNILTVIAGQASSMTEYVTPHTRPHDDALRILDAVRLGGALTRRINSMVRASHAHDQAALQPVSLGHTIRETLALLGEPVAERQIRVRVRRAEDMPAVLAEPLQLGELLMDLFLNALDAMPSGGTLTVDARRQRVPHPDVRLNPNARPGFYAALRIRDSGVGMSKDALEHLFEPFYTTKTEGFHIGLGLPAVHSAMQRYGGWMRVSSEPGRGTTVMLFMPVAPPSAKPPEAPTPRRAVPVLVADDSAPERQAARTALEKAGYKVHLAAGGEEAVRLLRAHANDIQLLIVDLMMPGRDGKDVVEESLRLNPALAVIVTSGFSRNYARSALPRGAWKFLQKPFTADQFVSAVQHALEPAAV